MATLPQQELYIRRRPPEAREFDYIIVGAGSAGSVLAARLTEDTDVSVLLLEAGGPNYALSRLRRIGPEAHL